MALKWIWMGWCDSEIAYPAFPRWKARYAGKTAPWSLTVGLAGMSPNLVPFKSSPVPISLIWASAPPVPPLRFAKFKIHLSEVSIFSKFTFLKSHISQNSHFRNLNFHKIHLSKISFFRKIHISKILFFAKFTFLKSHFS